MIVGVQPRPFFPRLRDEVHVGVAVARPRLVGARRADRVDERHLQVVGQGVAVGVDGIDAIQVEDHAADDAAGDSRIHALGLKIMRAVDEVAPEAIGHDVAEGVAEDDFAVEDVGAVAAVEGKLVAVPVQAHRAVGLAPARDEGLEEGQGVGRVDRVVQADALDVARHLEHARVDAGIDHLAARAPIGLRSRHDGCVDARAEAGEAELPQPLHDLVGRGRGAAVDGHGHAVGRVVGVADDHHAFAADDLVVGRVADVQLRSDEVYVHDLGGRVVEGRTSAAGLVDVRADFDGVQAFRNPVRGIGDVERPARAGAAHLLVVGADEQALVRVVRSAADLRIALAPLQENVRRRETQRAVDGEGGTGDARDGARLG